jgi:hypothetical protein
MPRSWMSRAIRGLSSDDLIVANIIQKQKIRGTEIIGDPRYELTNVVEYRSAPRNQQQRLFNDKIIGD